MKLKPLLLIIFFLWICGNAYSQKQAYIQYTVKDGLPSNNVYMGFQDSKGYMWFGTDAGLSRFDGYSFKNFDIQDGLPDTDIFDILEDKQGRIWFATYNGKIGYLQDHKFYNSSNSKILKGHDFNSYISCMYEDKKGNLWFGSRLNGFKYLDTHNKFHEVPRSKLYDNKNRVYTYAIWENNKGDVYALTNNALENLTQKKALSLKKIGIKLDFKDSRHYKILPLDNGQLILTENSNFYILNKEYKKIVKKKSYDAIKSTVLFLKKDASKKIWAGTYNGMFELNFPQDKHITSIDFLKNLTASSRKKDTQGNLWYTTLEKGIYFSPHTKVINYTVHDALPEEKVNAVDGNNKGDIIIGQENYYSFIKDGKINHFNEDPAFKINQTSTKIKHIYNVSLDDNENYIVSSVNGIVVGNKKNQKNYYSRVTRIAINYKKDSIIMGFSNLFKAKITELDFLSTKNHLPLKILDASTVNTLYWDEKDDSVWIGLIDGLIQIKNGKIINHFEKKPSLKLHITDIKPAKKENGIWLATNGTGTFLLDKKGTIKLHLTKKDGLSSNICKAVAEDDTGKLWIATSNGLNKLINKKSKNISKYGISDGILNDNINDLFIHKNNVWTATNLGVSVMDISNEKNCSIPIYITNTTLNGDYKKFSKTNNTFSYKENNISIDFVALDYNMGGEILYRYKIKKNQDWLYTKNNKIEFSSLKSGTYLFNVQAKNKQGYWSKNAATLDFKITKPWWETWWAILLYILLFLTLFFVFLKYESKKRALGNALLLEKKESIKLKELDRFKSQFFTNISHEIKTPLTLINGYISDLNLEASDETELNFKKQIHKITNIVDTVLDLAKMQSSNFKLHLETTNVSNIVYKLFINFKPLFDQKNIDFTISYNDLDYFSPIDALFFEKAINNLIVNALKYTDLGNVSINISNKDTLVIINVSDTGIGISNNNIEKVFNRFYQVNNDINAAGGSGIGLAFCKEIIELHSGTISLKSEINKGSEFTIILPLEKSLPSIIIPNENNIKKRNIKDSKSTMTYNSNLLFLVVDDNYDMRKYLLSILKDYKCLEAENGEQALEIIHTKTIDFIITDYMMPKLNGYDLVTKLKESNNSTPIIMLTAKTDINTKLDALKLGIDDYITKPFNKNELLVRIHNCIKNNTAKKSFNDEHNITINTYSNDNFIHKLKKYVIENSNKSTLNQDVIAEEFNVSKSSFYRKIKSNTGLSPNNFIKEIKLQKAREIIHKNSNISLKELSYEVGFNHTSYFSKIYKDRFGVKPLETKDY